jgi:hypothetical protein
LLILTNALVLLAKMSIHFNSKLPLGQSKLKGQPSFLGDPGFGSDSGKAVKKSSRRGFCEKFGESMTISVSEASPKKSVSPDKSVLRFCTT